MTELAFSADTDTGLPPLLLVHGMLVSRRTWDLNMPLRQQFRLICVDLPGHDASPALANAGEAHAGPVMEIAEIAWRLPRTTR